MRYDDYNVGESIAGVLLLSYTVPFFLGSLLMYKFSEWIGRPLTLLLASVITLVG